ncbi:hypothetical protein DFJ77DRAFT_246446 [Powellomyces hirtus]|nr:hypothetical protein DFJ77DRAFT_246446 [Powellomyces hirtus]
MIPWPFLGSPKIGKVWNVCNVRACRVAVVNYDCPDGKHLISAHHLSALSQPTDSLLMTLPTEVISIVVDYLWDEIIINVDTSTFLNLLRVNKTFHSIVIHRRRELMRAHAVFINTNMCFDVLLRQPSNLLSNRFVDPVSALFGLCNELVHEDAEMENILARDLAKFVLDNHKRFDSLIDRAEFPLIFESYDRSMSGASGYFKRLYQVPEAHVSMEACLLRNVTLCDIPYRIKRRWPYAVMIESPNLHGRGKVYAFRWSDDETAEVKVVKVDTLDDVLRDEEM